jgi:hypothetical protein
VRSGALRQAQIRRLHRLCRQHPLRRHAVHLLHAQTSGRAEEPQLPERHHSGHRLLRLHAKPVMQVMRELPGAAAMSAS